MSNPKQAYGDRKPPLHLVPAALSVGASHALGEGAPKYGPYNWREKPVENTTYIAALMRHALAYLDGENVDPESKTGKTHLEGIAGCIAILLDSEALGILIDKRPPAGPAPKMLRDPSFKPTLEEDKQLAIEFEDAPTRVVKAEPRTCSHPSERVIRGDEFNPDVCLACGTTAVTL